MTDAPPLVRHITVSDGRELGQIEAPLEYLFAAEGVYVRAARPGLAVTFNVADVPIRGLASIEPAILWDYPLVPLDVVEQLLAGARDAADRDLEILFHLCRQDNQWVCEVPEQEQERYRCKAITSGLTSSSRRALIELHSHHNMPAFFSPEDDKSECGFRIYAVIGHVSTQPEILVRVGLHGYWCPVPAYRIFDLPDDMIDLIPPFETGFIVESVEGDYLTNTLAWEAKLSIDKAYVHSPALIDDIVSLSADWSIKPARVYPATYDFARDLAIPGNPIRIGE